MKLWEAEGEANRRANREDRPMCVCRDEATGEHYVRPDHHQAGEELVAVKLPDAIGFAKEP